MIRDGLSSVAAVLANGTRAAFCDALLDGRPWSVSRLAAEAGVSMATASEHVSVLVGAGLCREHRQGRHRLVELADARVAAVVEDLAALAGPADARPPVPTLRAASKRAALARGRTCYDHLAGRLGVAVGDAFQEMGVLDTDLAVTPAGRGWIDANLDGPVPRSRRPFSRTCLDWTEQRPHLAGSAGAHVCGVFLRRGWVERLGTGRAVRLTRAGQAHLTDLGLSLPADLGSERAPARG